MRLHINRIWLVVLAAALQLFSCGPETVRVFGPVGSYEVEVYRGTTGIIRTEYCNISVVSVGNDDWRFLYKSGVFSGEGSGFPSEPCFCVMIANTWDRPLQVSRVEVLSGSEVVTPEMFSFAGQSEYYKERYAVDLRELWKTRKMLSDTFVLRDIDFENDTIEYRMDYIVPGDAVLFFRTFRWIPRNIPARLRVGIKYLEMEKVIDFDLAGFEYYESEPGETKMLPEVKLK